MFFMFFSRIALIRVRMGKNKKRPDLETSRGKSGDATHFFLHLWEFGSCCERSAGCAALECALERWKEQG